MKKILLSFSFMFLFSFLFLSERAVFAQSFSDVPEWSEYYDAVEEMVEIGSINATDKFRPNELMTRAQLAKIMAITLDLDLAQVKNPNFKDVKTSNHFYPYIAALVEAGIVSGYQDGTFRPNSPVTRGQMAKFIVNGFGFTKSQDPHAEFSDLNAGSEVYENAHTLLFYNITKVADYKPLQPVKRSQMALFISRASYAQWLAADEVRLPIRQLDMGKVGYFEEYFLTNEYVTQFGVNVLKDELVLLPIEPGQTALYHSNGGLHLQIDVDGNYNVYYQVVSELDPEYKESFTFSIYPDIEKPMRNVYFESMNFEENIVRKVLLADYPGQGELNGPWLRATGGAELWRARIEFLDGTTEIQYAYSYETPYMISLERLTIGSSEYVEYTIDEYFEDPFELVDGEPENVMIRNRNDGRTEAILFTAPGVYRFSFSEDAYLEIEVVNVDNKLGYIWYFGD